MNRLANKVALITGGGTGIGRATAILFAEEGASVVIMGRRKDPLSVVAEMLRKEGATALALAGDINNENVIRWVLDTVIKELGGIDILINNAGIAAPRLPVHEHDDDTWATVINTNLTGTFRITRAMLKHFIDRRSGTIVNIASISGLVGMPGMLAYSVSKSGIIALTKSVAVEYGHLGIRCNCICPGTVITTMTGASLIADQEQYRKIASANPLRRLGTPRDIAGATLYLASDESSAMTGSILTIDCGYVAQ